MKKIDIVNLIRAYATEDDEAFRRIANQIACDFYDSGDEDLGKYISGLFSKDLNFVPQESSSISSPFLSLDRKKPFPIVWPEALFSDIYGVFNSFSKKGGIHKVLLYGPSGTGKTETARLLASKLGAELWSVNMAQLVDYKLGETAKNITSLFQSVSKCRNPSRVLFLFDEIDAIALDRVSQFDLREMGRATTAFLKGLDSLPSNVRIIATTNLFDRLDDALKRRFDVSIDFGRYSREDLIEVATRLYEHIAAEQNQKAYTSFFKKIASMQSVPLYPGDMANIVRAGISFASDNDPQEHLRIIYRKLFPNYTEISEKRLQDENFTLREIAALTGKSTTTVHRGLSSL